MKSPNAVVRAGLRTDGNFVYDKNNMTGKQSDSKQNQSNLGFVKHHIDGNKINLLNALKMRLNKLKGDKKKVVAYNTNPMTTF